MRQPMRMDDIEIRRRKLRFRAWHRGMREMDLLFGRFADAHIATLPVSELDQLETLMDQPDQEVFSWLTGESATPADLATPLMARLREFRPKPQ
ncbi:MAG: succinate dehydrogenase assembly factor 2 [Hyphomicrobiales bacterium]|nr:succinate dehydrogenase assembly factor 2 [Hyphomicrobiales bacterium]